VRVSEIRGSAVTAVIEDATPVVRSTETPDTGDDGAVSAPHHGGEVTDHAVGAPSPVASVADRLSAAVAVAHQAGAPSVFLRVDDCREGWSWSGAAGTLARDGGDPVSIDTAFRIASITKSATAALALGVVADRTLPLDEPLAASPGAEIARELPHGGRLTLRHLLAHTSGLANYSTDPDFRRRLLADPRRSWAPTELLAEIRRIGAVDAPGERFSYSDSGYVVAGLVVECALGVPLHVALRRHLFDPAGMDTTWLEGHEQPRARAVAHHYDGDLDLSELTPTWDWAGGGLVSTLADLARHARSVIARGAAAAGALAEMRAWTAGVTFPPESPAQYERYGLGLGEQAFAGVRLVGHTGFIGSFIWWWPDRDVVLVGTHNRRDVDRRPLIEAAIRAANA
jgi:D-alanyl-D-alanine carboxypeptidase